MYDKFCDLNQVFAGCLVRYKGTPVKIHRGAGGILSFHSLMNPGKMRVADVNDPEWDFRTVPIGMVNHEDSVVYVYRKSARQYKQGLHPNNIGYKMIGSESNVDSIISLESPSLIQSITNQYPTFKQAVAEAKDVYCARAFSRIMAVDRRGYLYCRNTVVGAVERDGSITNMSSSSKFLLEGLNANS